MKILLPLIILVLSKGVFAVDINTANAHELARELSGVGKVKAQRIVEYREKIGGFISIEQLTKVHGIGPKTLERNRNKISISTFSKKTQPKIDKSTPSALPKTEINNKNKISTTYHTTLPPQTDSNLNLSPETEKPPRQKRNILWKALTIIPLFIICLFIFVAICLKNARKDKPVLRKHLISTTFVCSGCGKTSRFQNVRYEGHINNQYVDGDLPPGWSCILNWLGKPCDYCFDCSQKVHSGNLFEEESKL